MPEWLHLLGIGAVLAGCGWIGFAPTPCEWFWTPRDAAIAVIVMDARGIADSDPDTNPPKSV